MVQLRRFAEAAAGATPELVAAIRSLARPLRGAADLDPLLARIGDARCVLLGEATHGTHEFYAWRAELNESRAVRPLHVRVREEEVPETFPAGV